MLQYRNRIGVSLQGQVSNARLPPHFIGTELRINLRDRLEMRQRRVRTALLPVDLTKLKMRLRLVRIDRERLTKPLRGLFILPPRLINQPKLDMRGRMPGIDGRRLQVTAKSLPAAQSLAQVLQVSAEVAISIKQQERRGEVGNHKSQNVREEQRTRAARGQNKRGRSRAKSGPKQN